MLQAPRAAPLMIASIIGAKRICNKSQSVNVSTCTTYIDFSKRHFANEREVDVAPEFSLAETGTCRIESEVRETLQ